jgi:hypothetical protein
MRATKTKGDVELSCWRLFAAAAPCREAGGLHCPATISNGDTQVIGPWTLVHFGQVNTWVPDSLLPSAERQSETVICHSLTQERPGLQ